MSAPEICQAGELVLRQPGARLTPEEIISTPIQELIAAMFETMRAAPGVGLAAPQIGLPLQIAVIEDPQEFIDKMPPSMPPRVFAPAIAPHVIVNPRITIEDPEIVEFFEGCLSLTGFTAIVPRALAVRVDCLNEHGEPTVIIMRADGTRVFCSTKSITCTERFTSTACLAALSWAARTSSATGRHAGRRVPETDWRCLIFARPSGNTSRGKRGRGQIRPPAAPLRFDAADRSGIGLRRRCDLRGRVAA